MINPTPDVNCKYGAPMGRMSKCHPGHEAVDLGRVYLRRIPLDAGGYDRGGAYWGSGLPIYWAGNDAGDLDYFFRAASREAARAHMREIYPDLKFYR